jgi:hypothetical protein
LAGPFLAIVGFGLFVRPSVQKHDAFLHLDIQRGEPLAGDQDWPQPVLDLDIANGGPKPG